MAEETHQHADIDDVSHDDMTVMSSLLRTVKGLSPISTAPVLEDIALDDYMS